MLNKYEKIFTIVKLTFKTFSSQWCHVILFILVDVENIGRVEVLTKVLSIKDFAVEHLEKCLLTRHSFSVTFLSCGILEMTACTTRSNRHDRN